MLRLTRPLLLSVFPGLLVAGAVGVACGSSSNHRAVEDAEGGGAGQAATAGGGNSAVNDAGQASGGAATTGGSPDDNPLGGNGNGSGGSPDPGGAGAPAVADCSASGVASSPQCGAVSQASCEPPLDFVTVNLAADFCASAETRLRADALPALAACLAELADPCDSATVRACYEDARARACHVPSVTTICQTIKSYMFDGLPICPEFVVAECEQTVNLLASSAQAEVLGCMDPENGNEGTCTEQLRACVGLMLPL